MPTVQDYVRMGAADRLIELRVEIDEIRDTFPERDDRTPGPGRSKSHTASPETCGTGAQAETLLSPGEFSPGKVVPLTE